MRKLFYANALAVVAVIIAGCSQKEENSRTADAAELFARSVAVTTSYTDSIVAARDSGAVLRFARELDDSLSHLNFDFPADTDLEMNEGQNDTLANLLTRVAVIRDSLLYEFAHPRLTTDSVATDSIPDSKPSN